MLWQRIFQSRPPMNSMVVGMRLRHGRWYNYYESRVPLENCALRFNPDEIAVCRDQSSAGSPRLRTNCLFAWRSLHVTPAAAGRTRSVTCGTLRGRRQRVKTAPQNLLNLAPANTCPKTGIPTCRCWFCLQGWSCRLAVGRLFVW